MSKRMSASAAGRKSDEAKKQPTQRNSPSMIVAHAEKYKEENKLLSKRMSASAAGGRSDEAKEQTSKRKSASMIVAHARRSDETKKLPS
jgi:hypothetical protein